LRLPSRLPGRAHDAGCEDHPDLRGDQRNPTIGDCPRSAKGEGVTIKQLYVAGAGLMGAGITQIAITCGFDVTLREVDDKLVARGVDNIKKRLDSLVQKSKLDAAQRDAALSRLHQTPSLEDAGRAAFVIVDIPVTYACTLGNLMYVG